MAEKKTKKDTPDKKGKTKAGSDKKSKQKSSAPEIKIPIRLYDYYKSDVVPQLMKTFAYSNVMMVPRLSKIVINMGVGAAVADSKVLEEANKELEAIAGQKPSIRKAKKSISNFKLREGVNIGTMVTLRRERMYEFLDRLVNVALPRVRDFRGLSDKSFDGRGNFTLGVKEQIIFPEINVDKVTRVMGMDITLVTTAKTDNESYELLKAFGMPFIKKEIKTA
ncbi:MAG: 50S ribosomal protein L5 [Ignavibacteriaceae bacterium]|nr:50S ribosomal protein L5 [Ignavibacteriaceae bacterium]